MRFYNWLLRRWVNFDPCNDPVQLVLNGVHQWWHQWGGGGLGVFPTLRRRLFPHLPPPPSEEKKIKIGHFRQIFGFLTLRNEFFPLDAPHKKKKKKKNLVPPLVSTLGMSLNNHICFYIFLYCDFSGDFEGAIIFFGRGVPNLQKVGANKIENSPPPPISVTKKQTKKKWPPPPIHLTSKHAKIVLKSVFWNTLSVVILWVSTFFHQQFYDTPIFLSKNLRLPGTPLPKKMIAAS